MKQVLTLLFVATTTIVFAQTSQGDWQVGGDVTASFGNSKSEFGGSSGPEDKVNSISVSPRVGKFIVDNLAVGLGLGLSSSKVESEDGSFVNKSNSLMVAPYVRYYTDGGFFGHGSVGFGSAKSTSESGGSEFETKFSTFNWEIGPGYAYFISESVAFEGLLTYGSMTQTVKDSDPEQKDIFSGISFRIGCFVFLN